MITVDDCLDDERWEAIPPDERHAAIAERVMGWTRHPPQDARPEDGKFCYIWWDDVNHRSYRGENNIGFAVTLPHFDKSPNNDYRVLEQHQREKPGGCSRFQRALHEIQSPRGWRCADYGAGWMYKPGDWSRAALAVRLAKQEVRP